MEDLTVVTLDKEIWREYIYPNGGVLRIENPDLLYRKKSNPHSHRIVTTGGDTYYPAPGWIGIHWNAPAEPVSF